MWKGLEALFAVLFYLAMAIFLIYVFHHSWSGLFGSTIGAIIVIILTGWLISTIVVAVKESLKEPLDKDKSSDPTVKDEQDTLSG